MTRTKKKSINPQFSLGWLPLGNMLFLKVCYFVLLVCSQ